MDRWIIRDKHGGRNKDARKNRRFLSDRRGKRSFQVSYGKITGNNFQEKISRLTEFDGEWKIYIYIYTGILEKVRRIDVAEEGI